MLERCLLGAVKLMKHVDVDCTNILDMVLDLIEKDFSRLVMKFEEM